MPPEHFSKPELGDGGVNFARIKIGESTGTAGGGSAWRFINPLFWFGKQVTYITELRYFNSFRRELSNLPDRKEEQALTSQNPTREQRAGDECWTEEQLTYRISTRPKTVVSQRFEIWSINTTKQGYYSVATGWEPVAVDAAILGSSATFGAMGQFAKAASGTAGRMGTAAVVSEGTLATGSMFLTGVARANAVLGVGMLVFQGTSWIMILASDDGAGGTEELVSEGWELSDIEYGEWEDAGTEQRWEEVAGSRGPCPEDGESGDHILVPGGRLITPPGAGTTAPREEEPVKPPAGPRPTGPKTGWKTPVLRFGLPGLLGLVLVGGVWIGTSGSEGDDAQGGVPGATGTADDATASASASPPPTELPLEPLLISPINVVNGPETTDYTIDVGEPGPLTYEWSGADCGSAEPDASTYIWDHRGASLSLSGGIFGNQQLSEDECDHDADPTHSTATIQVVVNGPTIRATCTYHGVASGVGPACDAVRMLNGEPLPPIIPPDATATPAGGGSAATPPSDALGLAITRAFAGGASVPWVIDFSAGSCSELATAYQQTVTISADASRDEMTLFQGGHAPTGQYPTDHATVLEEGGTDAEEYTLDFYLDGEALMFQGTYTYQDRCNYEISGRLG